MAIICAVNDIALAMKDQIEMTMALASIYGHNIPFGRRETYLHDSCRTRSAKRGSKGRWKEN